MTTRRDLALGACVFITFISAGFAGRSSNQQEKGQNDQSLLTMRGHDRWVSAVAFSPDGKLIISGSGDDTLKIWDAHTGKEKLTLRADGKGVTALAVSRDGNYLASGHWNKTIKIWELPGGKELFTLRGHKESITSVAFSLDGKRIVSGSADDTMKI